MYATAPQCNTSAPHRTNAVNKQNLFKKKNVFTHGVIVLYLISSNQRDLQWPLQQGLVIELSIQIYIYNPNPNPNLNPSFYFL